MVNKLAKPPLAKKKTFIYIYIFFFKKYKRENKVLIHVEYWAGYKCGY